jgi:hypothetical protein
MFVGSFSSCYTFFVCLSTLIFKFCNLLLHSSDTVFGEENFLAHNIYLNFEHVIISDSVVKTDLLVLYVMMKRHTLHMFSMFLRFIRYFNFDSSSNFI